MICSFVFFCECLFDISCGCSTSSSIRVARTAPVIAGVTYVSISGSLSTARHTAPIRPRISTATTSTAYSSQTTLTGTAAVHITLRSTKTPLLATRASGATTRSVTSVASEVTAPNTTASFAWSTSSRFLLLHIKLLSIRAVFWEVQWLWRTRRNAMSMKLHSTIRMLYNLPCPLSNSARKQDLRT